MRRAQHLCLGILLVVGCRPRAPALSPADIAARTAVAAANNRFGFDLLPRLGPPTENVVASPATAAIALTMAAAGAGGTTLGEMARVLRLRPDALADAHRGFAATLRSLDARDGYDGLELALANRLWASQGVVLETKYLALLDDAYRASVGELDAASGPAMVNAWVSKATRGRIPTLVSALPSHPSLVLTSVVYMKAAWLEAFEPDRTRRRPFITAAGRVPVMMMRRAGVMPYAHLDGVQVLELPYKGGLSMVVFLPDEQDGLAALERQIGERYEAWIAALAKEQVDLRLPKWAITSDLRLEDALAVMGISKAFSRHADFSAISRSTPLMVSSILQKAVIEVNELGTEAAAATSLGVKAAAALDPVLFVADHPFVYVIRDVESGFVLFIGRVARPPAAHDG